MEKVLNFRIADRFPTAEELTNKIFVENGISYTFDFPLKLQVRSNGALSSYLYLDANTMYPDVGDPFISTLQPNENGIIDLDTVAQSGTYLFGLLPPELAGEGGSITPTINYTKRTNQNSYVTSLLASDGEFNGEISSNLILEVYTTAEIAESSTIYRTYQTIKSSNTNIVKQRVIVKTTGSRGDLFDFSVFKELTNNLKNVRKTLVRDTDYTNGTSISFLIPDELKYLTNYQLDIKVKGNRYNGLTGVDRITYVDFINCAVTLEAATDGNATVNITLPSDISIYNSINIDMLVASYIN